MKRFAHIALMLALAAGCHPLFLMGQTPTMTGPWVLDSSLILEVHNLGTGINTDREEYAPTIAPDGRTLFFVRSLKNGDNSDIWVAHRTSSNGKDSLFDAPAHLGPPINSPANEGALAVSSDEQIMIFTACNRSDGQGDCDLYEITANDSGPATMRNLAEINTEAWESQPSLSSDGYVLYFASNRVFKKKWPRTDDDIYVSALQKDGHWGPPQALEPPINTQFRDESPCIANGDSLLFFSSDRPGGYGGFDLYVSMRRGDNTWGPPKNLGPLFNSAKDDRFISVASDGKTFYYSSQRTDLPHHGNFNIYVVRPVSSH